MVTEFLIETNRDKTPRKVQPTGSLEEITYGFFALLSELSEQNELFGITVKTAKKNNQDPINFEI